MNTLFQTITKTDDNVVNISKSSSVEQSIHIEGLELLMSIGVLPAEKTQKQLVIIDAQIVITPILGGNDNIDHVLSYVDIIENIKSIASAGHINLVETFAEKIIANCLSYNTVQKVDVTIKKPDIIAECKSVGCTLSAKK